MAEAVPNNPSEFMFGDFSEFDYSSLCDSYLQLSALRQAISASQLKMVAHMVEFSSKDSVVEFLHFKDLRTRHNAREFVDVSCRIGEFQNLADSYAQGIISWRQLSYLIPIAKCHGEQFALECSENSSLNQLRHISDEAKVILGERKKRAETEAADLGDDEDNVDSGEPVDEEQGTADSNQHPDFEPSFYDLTQLVPANLNIYRKGGRFVLHGELPIELGIKIIKALDLIADSEGIDPATNEYRPLPQRRASALLEICSSKLSDHSNTDLATTVIHVDLDGIISSDIPTASVDGNVVALNKVRHLMCDSRLQVISERNGIAVGIGRLSREIPHWLRRIVHDRDQGCRFPNCQTTKGVQGHHIRWWRNGGSTNSDNLI